MLNRKSGLAGAPPLGFSRPSNEGLFIRRVSAINDDSKQSTADEASSPEWGSPDALRSAGNAISWSADNLHYRPRELSGSSFAQLESPKSSYIGSPTRCTGGGHGEVGPSSSGGMRLSFGSDPAVIPQSQISPTRKSTPLARHLAERALMTRSTRRSIDCPNALRSRESAPVYPNSSLPNATPLSVNAISAPACSSSSTFEKLPSFLRNSTPIMSANSAPEPAAPSAPVATPHPPIYASTPSSSSILVPWINNNNSNSNNNSMHSLNPHVPHSPSCGKDPSSPNTTSRALTPVSPSTPPSSQRPSRHGLLGARRISNGPSSLPSAGENAYMDLSLGGRLKPATPGVAAAVPGPTTLAAVLRRPASPPPFQARQPPSCGLIHLWSGAPAAMRRGEWTMAQFAIARQLYGGYASSVFKARCLRSSLDVVLKVYSLSSLSDFLRNQVLRELDIHSRLEHPGVVQLMAAFREGDKLVLVLEYVRGGSLDRARRKLGGRLSEQQALELVLVPLLRTLHYLHSRQIVHRDIKPENILFSSDWKLKVCDYGVSVCLAEERAVTRTGSRDYMAPEVQVCPLKRSPDDNKTNTQLAYGASADMWSLGVLTYELLVGFTPFPGGPPPPEDRSVGGGVRALAFPSCISADARSFVHACLQDVPGDRPTIFELLKHRWVQGALA